MDATGKNKSILVNLLDNLRVQKWNIEFLELFHSVVIFVFNSALQIFLLLLVELLPFMYGLWIELRMVNVPSSACFLQLVDE